MSNELDEKVVPHTGGEGVKPAETPEPVAGEGGAVAKKKERSDQKASPERPYCS